MLDEAERQGLALTTLDDARSTPRAGRGGRRTLGVTQLGRGRGSADLERPAQVAEFAWRARRGRAGAGGLGRRAAGDRALRELLALQASDWAFLRHRELAGDYPEQRAQLHADALAGAIRDPDGAPRAARSRAVAQRLVVSGASRNPAIEAAAPRRRRLRQPQRNVRGASRIRISRAGAPPTTALAGTSVVTTELVPITALSPTVTPRRTQAP